MGVELSSNMSRFFLFAILVASASAYQTFTAEEYTSTTCAGSVKTKLTIPVSQCSHKLKLTSTSTGMQAQLYSTADCSGSVTNTYTKTTAEMAACTEIDGKGFKFSTAESTSAYALKFVFTTPADVGTVYVAADTCMTVETTNSLKAASTTATSTNPKAWSSSATCAGTANEDAGVQTSPYSLSITDPTIVATIEVVTLDSSGATTTNTAAGNTNAPTSSSNSASSVALPLFTILAALFFHKLA